MVAFQFNASGVTPRYSASDGLPHGKHPVIISASEFRPTKDSTPNDPRSMLVFTLEAIDGPAKGGKQTDRLNLQHPNQQVVNIAYSQLAAYCAVTGRQGFNDTSELHNIPFMIEVGPQKNNPEYSEVKGVYFTDGRDAASGAAPASPPFAQPAAPQMGGQGSQPFQQPSGATQNSIAGPHAGIATTAFPSSAPQQFQPGPAPAGAAPPWARQ